MKSTLRFFTLFTLIIAAGCSGPPESWEFQYPGDSFSPEALLDLRYLNEESAGEHGFIRLSEDGESFVRGDGKEIRFWPVNGGGSSRNMSDEELAWHARFLAKQGVNMNRWHGSVNPPGEGTGLYEIDTAEVEDIWRWVAAMKREGIYSTISPFWAHNGHMGGWVPAEWGIDGYSGKDALWEVMYFNDRLKEAYKHWVRYLYTRVNPHTGVALNEEPAVALIQVKNEDGVFFWTMQHIKPELKRMAARKFARWLTAKYGSAEAALEAWDGESLPEDDPQAGTMDLYLVWEMTRPQEGGKALRLADQTEFMARTQRDFYREMHDFYRDELGCRQLINPNNWKTADPARLNDLERWTYLDCEVPAVNRYYAPGHAGENNGWRIDPGHYYRGISALKQPDRLPVNIKQVTGAPMLVTESGWNLPHVYQSEAPALIAAYQSLTGHDAFYWFYITSQAYMEFPYFEFTRDSLGRYAMNRWTYSTPGGIAQFPAYALLYRMGYLSQGETVVREHRTLQELWDRKPPLISEMASFDPNRDPLEGIRTTGSGGSLSPLTFLTGPVKVTYGGKPRADFIHEDLPDLIDAEAGTVRSITGEIALDYHRGVFTFSSAKAAGFSGFADPSRTYDLGPVALRTGNDYVTVGVVSMDGLPLGRSRKILVQTGTTYRPTGWKQESARFGLSGDTVSGFRILDTGRMPWVAEATKVKLTLNNPGITRAFLLDGAGYASRDLDTRQRGGNVAIDLPGDALYVVLLGE